VSRGLFTLREIRTVLSRDDVQGRTMGHGKRGGPQKNKKEKKTDKTRVDGQQEGAGL